jgi:AraC-like DNA-binding protein
MVAAESRQEWIDSLLPAPFRHLFDHLPGTLFFAKDGHGRFTMGNPAFVRRCGFEREDQLLGLADDGIFPPRLAEKYRRDDRHVMQSRKPLLGIIELFPNAEGRPEWFVTDKLPLFDRQGACCGVVGTVRSYEAQRTAIAPYLELADVAERIQRDFKQPLDVARLARMAGLSVRQFSRKFRRTFQATPRDYLMRIRILHACSLLQRTDLPITAVALQSGFYDHSDFARHFRRQLGLSASAWRQRNSRAPDAPT